MKKLLIVTNFVWAAAFFMAFKSEPVSQQKKCDTFCSNYQGEPLQGIIPFEKAKMVFDEYKNNTPGRKDDDATSIWFSLETLKKFIWTIESNVCQNCPKPQKLGVRIYYGRYPQSTPNVNSRYYNKHTVFMVATFDKAPNQHFDFNPWAIGSTCNLQNAGFSGRSTKAFILDPISAESTGTISSQKFAQNMGCLDPPGCPEGRVFY